MKEYKEKTVIMKMETESRQKRFNIAIDGPAGAGKSTIAKIVAKQLGSIYVDTGAMYRAMAVYLLRKGIKPISKEPEKPDSVLEPVGSETGRDPMNQLKDTGESGHESGEKTLSDKILTSKEAFVKQVEDLCDGADISIEYAADGQQVVLLDGENVNALLRTQEVSDMASMSSTVGKLRKHLVKLQQKLAATRNVVMDGRDIGTVVLPDAQLKIYLTASVEVRAKRRYLENVRAARAGAKKSEEDLDLEAIKKDIAERDHRDMTRKESPLKQAEDAVLVDTSDLSIDQAAETILNLAADRLGRPRVITASTAGFCFGVQNAIDTVYREIEKSSQLKIEKSDIVTFGPIIHNTTVVDELKAKGVGIINSVEEAKLLCGANDSLHSANVPFDSMNDSLSSVNDSKPIPGDPEKMTGRVSAPLRSALTDVHWTSSAVPTVIIRSHGVSRDTYEALEATGAKVVDTTCTFVKKIHRIVEEASRAGKQVVVIGNHGHAETEGTVGWIAKPDIPLENEAANKNFSTKEKEDDGAKALFNPVTVIETGEEARNYRADPKRPVCIVAQTTFNVQKFQNFVALIRQNGYNIEVNETICNATSERQAEARRIAREADVMIVIGDRQSSNTAKLYEICRQECGRTYFIQTADELDLELTGREKVIGITAGASTPKKIIEEVQSSVRRTDF